MAYIYNGVWPTMVTAFDENGELDFEQNKKFTEYLIEQGSDGLFSVCQSSEMFMLSTEEKVALAKCVVEAAAGRVPVIASGHTSESIEEQIEELTAVSQSGVDAVVLVSNRLAQEGEGSDIFLGNLSRILTALPDVKFGIYECPYPYRRLLTDEELKWCADSGRIIFLKDVSCDVEIEKRRVKVVEGTTLKLFNANTETLLDSLIAGYDGYNGIMGNFHIDIYKWLFTHHQTEPLKARDLQKLLTEKATIENFAYPINAKYHAQQSGVNMTLYSRRLKAEAFDAHAKTLVDDLINWENEVRNTLTK